MATAMESKIKMAMKNIGLGEKADSLLDMLDEIELDIVLKESEDQFKKGETITLEESEKITSERLNNGYYLR